MRRIPDGREEGTCPMPMIPLALSLSGGGSRAAGFHRGVVAGLREVGLLGSVGAVSTVSGGSIFGAAWMAARARGEGDEGKHSDQPSTWFSTT